MIRALKRAYANFRGFDLDGRTVPPMDGPLRPNTKLDGGHVALELADVDNLVRQGDTILCSVGNELLRLEEREAGDGGIGLSVADRRPFAHAVSAMASDGQSGLAVGLDGHGVTILGGPHDGKHVTASATAPLACVTALAFLDPDRLLVCNGSHENPAAEWKRDLMTYGSSGSLWKIDLRAEGSSPARLAEGLAFPCGIAVSGRRAFVSEAWRHRVLSVDLEDGSRNIALGSLPAYPGRILPTQRAGFWLAMFAPRNPLVEFVLREDDYRRRMVATIEPDYWIAPSLITGRSFLEPIQGGARKKLNMLKPWSPTWSTGLVVRCDAEMHPLESLHSRADGNVHGVTSLSEYRGRLLVGAKGSGVVVAIDDFEGDGAQ